MNKLWLLSLSLFLFPAACNNSSSGRQSEKPIVVVSIEPQQYVMDFLVKDDFKVITLLDRGSDPETFEPTAAKRLMADKADLFLAVGSLPFEDKFAANLSDNVKTYKSDKGIKYIFGTHSHGHSHEDEHCGDPHIWSSPSGMKIVGSNMAEALVLTYPHMKDSIYSRLSKFNNHVDSIDESLKLRLSADPVHAFAVWHPSLSYLARDYALEQISVGQESKEMSSQQIRSVIDQAREKGVKIFFFQREYDSRQAKVLNSEIGSRLVVVEPLSKDWEGQLNLIVNELVKP